MNILDAIVEHKRVEVLKRKQKRPIADLGNFPHYKRRCNPIVLPESGRPGIIAEFKRQSPSKGPINLEVLPVNVAKGYQQAGVSVMSVLTDRKFFGGSFQDLRSVREECPDLPLLRKDFMLDPYQLHEAKAYGADMILLIAGILEKNKLAELAAGAEELGMNVLLEVHDAHDLEKHVPGIKYVGVNNRDLKSFRVDTRRSLDLIGLMPEGVHPVSESGLGSPEEVKKLAKAGYQLFLMGESFMKETDPGLACQNFIKTL